MTVHEIHEAPPPALGRALAEFERQFVYPLGPGRSFRIEHGDDYPRFYRAIGNARCFVCEEEGRVLGVVSVAIRPVQWPDRSERPVAYIGDVKVAPGTRRGAVLLRMVRAAEAWCRPRAVAAFGVVMDGTPVEPSAYTGRLGIPAFVALGKTIVFRFSCEGSRQAREQERFSSTEADVRACSRRVGSGRYNGSPGTPAERSEMCPLWLAHPNGSASGCLEDTRRAKRLIADDGVEMRSAHLSCFACSDVQAGAELVREAIARAAALGFPALFVAVAETDAEALLAALSDVPAVRAPATLFGYQLEPGFAWNVSSSEI